MKEAMLAAAAVYLETAGPGERHTCFPAIWMAQVADSTELGLGFADPTAFAPRRGARYETVFDSTPGESRLARSSPITVLRFLWSGRR